MRIVTRIGVFVLLAIVPVSGLEASSLRFYGNGVAAPDLDRVKIPVDDVGDSLPGPPVDIGATDFTIELWLKANAGDNDAPAISCGNNIDWIYGNIVLDRDRYGQDRKFGLSLAGGVAVFGVSGEGSGDRTICGTSPLLDGSWHHIAIQRRRSDGYLWLYVDGGLEAQVDGPDGDVSYPDDAIPCSNCCNGSNCNFSDPFLVLGAEKHDAGASYPSYNGLLDELRLSNSLRYAGNFVRPTAPFSADAATLALYHLDEASGDGIADSSGASGGPSNGVRHYGGSPAGPEWAADSPFNTPGDADGDGSLDGVDECTLLLIGGQTTDRTTLKLSNLNDPAGSRKLAWSGRFLAAGNAAIAPHVDGLHVWIADSGGAVLDVSLPGGVVGSHPSTPCDARDGWKVSGTTYLYQNLSGFLDAACSVPAMGVDKIVIKDRRQGGGDIQFKVAGRRGSFEPVTPPLSLQATLALAAQPAPGIASPAAIAGQCGELRWSPPISLVRPAPYCAVSPSSGAVRKMICKGA